MSRGIQPEILATFETILPEHGDLEEYLQTIGFLNDPRAAQNASSSYILENTDLGFDEEDLDRAILLSFIDAQNLYTHECLTTNPTTEQNNNWSLNLSRNISLNSDLDAAIALSLEEAEEVDELITADEGEVTFAGPSAPVLVQDEIDLDDMTFEQLQSLEEAVGTESRGLSKELLDRFPVQRLIAKSGWFSSNKNDPEGCPICVSEYEIGSKLVTLPCLHLYHKSCIKQWLKDNKTCPICNTDISESESRVSSEGSFENLDTTGFTVL